MQLAVERVHVTPTAGTGTPTDAARSARVPTASRLTALDGITVSAEEKVFDQ